ncbi:MAG TPA: hypothetical protein VGI19_05670 [Candidatus Cybelea sp.]
MSAHRPIFQEGGELQQSAQLRTREIVNLKKMPPGQAGKGRGGWRYRIHVMYIYA